MISMEHARALGAHLAAQHGATILHPDDVVPHAVLVALDIADDYLPALAPITEALLKRLEHVSVTLPTPMGTVILLSRAACADPLSYARTVTHECIHAEQIARRGGPGIVVDYALSQSLRAANEGNGYGGGLGMHWLLTGEVLDASGPVASLSTDTYLLDAAAILLGGGIVSVHVDTMRAGLLPNLSTVVTAYRWLRAHAPEALRVTLAREPG